MAADSLCTRPQPTSCALHPARRHPARRARAAAPRRAGSAPTRRATWASSWSTARSASRPRPPSRATCAAWARACCPCRRWCARVGPDPDRTRAACPTCMRRTQSTNMSRMCACGGHALQRVHQRLVHTCLHVFKLRSGIPTPASERTWACILEHARPVLRVSKGVETHRQPRMRRCPRLPHARPRMSRRARSLQPSAGRRGARRGADGACVLQTKVARNPSYVPDFSTAFSHLLIHPGALIVIDQVCSAPAASPPSCGGSDLVDSDNSITCTAPAAAGQNVRVGGSQSMMK
jgi:hypothetical protein